MSFISRAFLLGVFGSGSRFLHVPPAFPTTKWSTNFGLPWWRDPKRVVGKVRSGSCFLLPAWGWSRFLSLGSLRVPSLFALHYFDSALTLPTPLEHTLISSEPVSVRVLESRLRCRATPKQNKTHKTQAPQYTTRRACHASSSTAHTKSTAAAGGEHLVEARRPAPGGV